MKSDPLVSKGPAGPEFPRWSETLRDRTPVLIRPITPEDHDGERAFIEALSDDARRYRFLGQVHCPSEEMLEQFTHIDYVNDVAFVAVVREHGHEHIVGVSRYATTADGSQCECAVTVSDEWQNKGLGTLLMRHLIEVARANGIRRMFSIDAAANVRMGDLARYLGFDVKPDPDDATQVIHELIL